jgi:hypothetical protein
MPTSWAKIGSPTVTENTNALYLRHSGSNAKVVALEHEGIETDAIDVYLSEGDPFLIAQAMLYVESGHVRMEMYDVTNDESWPEVPKDVLTVAVGEWIDNWALGPSPNGRPDDTFFDKGTAQVKIRFVAYDGAATFYLDAAMLLQQPSVSTVMFGGRASNELWRLANEALAITKEPEQRYQINMVDLNRLQALSVDTIDVLDINLLAQIIDEDLGIEFERMTRAVTLDLLEPGNSQIELEEKAHDLSTLLSDRRLLTREALDPSRYGEGTLQPSIKTYAATDHNTSTATLYVDTTDPQFRVQKVEFRNWDHINGWSAWVEDATGPPYSATKTLDEKHIVKIAYGVEWLNEQNLVTRVEDVVTFDWDTTPEPTAYALDIDADGNWTFKWFGDDDVRYIKYATTTNGDDLTESDVDTSGTRNPGAGSAQSGTITGGPLTDGQTLKIGVYYYNDDEATVKRYPSSTNLPVQYEATYSEAGGGVDPGETGLVLNADFEDQGRGESGVRRLRSRLHEHLGCGWRGAHRVRRRRTRESDDDRRDVVDDRDERHGQERLLQGPGRQVLHARDADRAGRHERATELLRR